MKIRLWGVRGSLPTPGPTTVRYGGNTACIEAVGDNGECIVLDAGTGIRPLGLDLLKRGKPLPPIHLFISHTHWDHIQGFPFFVPCYIPGTQLHVKGPVHFEEDKSLQSVFDLQMKYEYFPISNQQLAATIDYESIAQGKLNIGNIEISAQFTNHPILCLGYRLTQNGRSVVYTGDHEAYQNVFAGKSQMRTADGKSDALLKELDQRVEKANQRFVDFIRSAHLVIIDCQYTPQEYQTSRKGWGHSSWDYCLQWMKDGQVERMVLTHHDPTRTDEALDAMLAAVRAAAVEKGLDPQKISMATEGAEMIV